MLFMCIASYTPEQTPAMQKIGMEKGFPAPEGMKVIGEWAGIGAGRSFRVIETDDPVKLMESALPYTTLCKMEIIPVINLDEALKKLKA